MAEREIVFTKSFILWGGTFVVKLSTTQPKRLSVAPYSATIQTIPFIYKYEKMIIVNDNIGSGRPCILKYCLLYRDSEVVYQINSFIRSKNMKWNTFIMKIRGLR